MNVNKFNIKENKNIIKEIYSFSEVRNLFNLTNNQEKFISDGLILEDLQILTNLC